MVISLARERECGKIKKRTSQAALRDELDGWTEMELDLGDGGRALWCAVVCSTVEVEKTLQGDLRGVGSANVWTTFSVLAPTMGVF